MKTMSVFFVFLLALSTQASEKPRLPASLNCNSKTTLSLQDLAYKLNVDGTLRQSRYEKMMNSFSTATDCESVNEAMLSAVSDCTIKVLKKTNCK